MTQPNFGWHYPAGAEHDPEAPYNQPSHECLICGEPTPYAEGICYDCAREEAAIARAEREREERELDRW